MNIIINASNVYHVGGAAQVVDSICRELVNFKQHRFYVFFSDKFKKTADAISDYENTEVTFYAYPPKDLYGALTKRNKFLDQVVLANHIDCVLTVFGPSKWVPKCPHISGFAIPHLLFPESPFFKEFNLNQRFKMWFFVAKVKYFLQRSANVMFTENVLCSEILKGIFPKKQIHTVTNYYNQVFDQYDKWEKITLPRHDGTTILCVSSLLPHKNIHFCLEVAKAMKSLFPHFKFRFVLTVGEKEFGEVPNELKESFFFTGSLHITHIPSLYNQSDIVIQPSLLECFSATYPEAMRMERPLIVPDMEFTKGLCDNAALYYSPLSANEAVEKIYEVSTNEELRQKLIENGRMQLSKYDTSEQRAKKLIKLCESI